MAETTQAALPVPGADIHSADEACVWLLGGYVYTYHVGYVTLHWTCRRGNQGAKAAEVSLKCRGREREKETRAQEGTDIVRIDLVQLPLMAVVLFGEVMHKHTQCCEGEKHS